MSSGATILESTLASLQDLGRVSASWWGVATNGAADQFSLAYANVLVGNERDAPCVETVVTDLVIAFSHDTLVAIAGAQAEVTINEVPVRTHQALHVPAGATVSVRRLRGGVRAYLAVRGGFRTATRFLGSVSPDRTLDFGLELAVGRELAYEPVRTTSLPEHPFGYPHLSPAPVVPDGPARLGVLPGENEDLFEDVSVLFTEEYRLTDKTDAVGSRLSGPVPRRIDPSEILSRALPIGAIEVSGGELLVLNRGRGLSAGYPVVGVISGPSMNTVSQLGPGAAVHFVPVSVEEALRERRRQEEVLSTVSDRMSSLLPVLDVTPQQHRPDEGAPR